MSAPPAPSALRAVALQVAHLAADVASLGVQRRDAAANLVREQAHFSPLVLSERGLSKKQSRVIYREHVASRSEMTRVMHGNTPTGPRSARRESVGGEVYANTALLGICYTSVRDGVPERVPEHGVHRLIPEAQGAQGIHAKISTPTPKGKS